MAHFTYAVLLLIYIKYVFIWQQPIITAGMTPDHVMKNSHANYIRYALQYTRLPDLRYTDTRIYPYPEIYSLTL